MSGDAIREAMARALWPDCTKLEQAVPCIREGCRCAERADAALSALPISAAQLAEIAAGRAVVVPVEATEGIAVPVEVMRTTLLRVIGPRALAVFDEEMDRAMIAAAPREGEP
jgi:hypothetical protein